MKGKLFKTKGYKISQAEIEALMEKAKEYREDADYSALVKFSKKQAEETYRGAKKFVVMAEKIIKANKGSTTLKLMLL